MTLPMSHSMATLYSEVNAFLPVTFCRCNEPSISFVHCKTYQSSRIAAHWSHLHSQITPRWSLPAAYPSLPVESSKKT